MFISKKLSGLVLSLLFLSFLWPAYSVVTLPSLLSDNMVLQQGQPVHIWGKADRGEEVTVRLLNQVQTTVADEEGRWEVWMQPVKKSAKPVTMTVTGRGVETGPQAGIGAKDGSNTVVVKNILVGEVWLAAGQSNMEYSVRLSHNAEQEIAQADYPKLRFFDAQRSFSDTAKADIAGRWVLCSPETVAEMTATCYAFARGLHQHLNVPVGLIDVSWGATRCEAWTPASVFEADPRLSFWTTKWEQHMRDFPRLQAAYLQQQETWKAAAEKARLAGETPPRAPKAPELKTKFEPSAIYNGIVAPLSRYTIKGVVWYQGENNAYKEEAFPYRYLFPAMIDTWRQAWKQGDFPFLFAQLSTLNKHPYWPVLRESQVEALKLKNTAMVVTYDVGDSTDAHFKLKQVVGKRFELAARRLVYGEKVAASGPQFRQFTVEGQHLRVWFDHADGLKSSDGKALVGFEVAGPDGRLYPATATIDGETVLLHHEKVPHPCTARFAFKDAIIGNLINRYGLPAVPFRTDVRNGL